MGKKQIDEILISLNTPRYHNQKYLGVRIQRKVKRLVIYKLESSKGQVVKYSKSVRMRQFREYYGLINNKTAKIVGFTPNYIGVKPSKPIISRNYIKDYFSKNWDKISVTYPTAFNFINKSLNKERIVFDAGFDTATEHLKENFSESTFKYTRDEVLNILEKSSYKWFNTPLIKCDDPEELKLITNYNKDSRPGMYTSMIVSRKREFSHLYSLDVAKKLYDRARKFPLKNWNLWEILGREKDVKINNSNTIEKVSTRIVVSTEENSTLLASWFAQKAQLGLEVSNSENKFHLRGEFNSRKYDNLFSKRLEYDYYLAADWRFYDSNVDAIIIQISMVIILGGIIENQGKEGERLVFYLLNYQICKYIAVPPGVVVELKKANPSGSAFTTINNCVSNLIYWCLIGHKIYGDNYAENMDVEVYGDDAYVFFKNNDNLWNIDVIINQIGLKSDPLVTSIKPCDLTKDIDNDHDFLKRQFNYCGIQWNQGKMFDRLLFQTKKRSVDDQFSLVLSYIVTAPFNNEVNNLLIDVLKHLRQYHEEEICHTNLEQLLKIDDVINDSKDRLIINSIKDEPINKKIEGLCKMHEQILKANTKRGSTFLIKRYIMNLLDYLSLPVDYINQYLDKNYTLIPKHLDEYDFLNSKYFSIEYVKNKAYFYVDSLIKDYQPDTS